MAEALVSLVLDQFGSVLRQELEQEVGLVVGVRKQVEDLTTTLTMLQAFLRDADVKQVKDEAVNVWLQELKQIAYDADDVLDEWRTRNLLSQQLFCQKTNLRSLDLIDGELPDEVERLLYLPYLDLSNTSLTELPETMCNLYSLQTLIFITCRNLCKLPEGIGRLLNLRHLECEGTTKLNYFPQGFDKLKHLRTLTKFVVSNANGVCKVEELEDLNLISGGLKIIGLRQLENVDEAKRAELQRKENIISLTLSFIEKSERMLSWENHNMKKRMVEIIEGLQPPINLEQLVIRCYSDLAFPSWMSMMSNMVDLHLFNCENCTQLPALGVYERKHIPFKDGKSFSVGICSIRLR